MLRSHTFTQPALACVGSRDSAPAAMPPLRIALKPYFASHRRGPARDGVVRAAVGDHRLPKSAPEALGNGSAENIDRLAQRQGLDHPEWLGQGRFCGLGQRRHRQRETRLSHPHGPRLWLVPSARTGGAASAAQSKKPAVPARRLRAKKTHAGDRRIWPLVSIASAAVSAS